jgi:adenylosuccinate synthase
MSVNKMQTGLNVVVDAWWGSSGKGKVTAALAERYGVQHVSSSNHPNAGHTWVDGARKIVFKSMSSGSAASPVAHVWLSPDSVFDPHQLRAEWEASGKPNLHIHTNALALTDGDRDFDYRSPANGIASTAQGGFPATIRKMTRFNPDVPQPIPNMREAVMRVFEDVNAVQRPVIWEPQAWVQAVRAVAQETALLHEVAQGTGLSLDHGSHYPFTTYRNCLTASALEDLGLAPQFVRDVFLVIRTFPIRVGSTSQGSSGPFPADCDEVTWEDVFTRSGAPEGFFQPEYTTVTKRLRRVATPSWSWLEHAARMNGATKLCVTFGDYLGFANRRAKEGAQLGGSAWAFIAKCEAVCKVPVVMVSVGPDQSETVWLDRRNEQ